MRRSRSRYAMTASLSSIFAPTRNLGLKNVRIELRLSVVIFHAVDHVLLWIGKSV